MEEIWKDISGYEGLYQASNLGNIKSLNYNHTKQPRNLTPVKHKNGYLFVYIGGKHKSVHRIIAATFIPNQKNKPQVNHINGDKTDNRVENLSWVSAAENMRHAYKNNLINLNTPLKRKSELENIKKANEHNRKVYNDRRCNSNNTMVI